VKNAAGKMVVAVNQMLALNLKTEEIDVKMGARAKRK
jgi:hypothetical protein